MSQVRSCKKISIRNLRRRLLITIFGNLTFHKQGQAEQVRWDLFFLTDRARCTITYFYYILLVNIPSKFLLKLLIFFSFYFFFWSWYFSSFSFFDCHVSIKLYKCMCYLNVILRWSVSSFYCDVWLCILRHAVFEYKFKSYALHLSLQ